MEINKLRKQIRFRNEEELTAINIAVKIIGDTLMQGEQITFSSFVRAAANKAALEIIRKNPNHMKDIK